MHFYNEYAWANYYFRLCLHSEPISELLLFPKWAYIFINERDNYGSAMRGYSSHSLLTI